MHPFARHILLFSAFLLFLPLYHHLYASLAFDPGLEEGAVNPYLFPVGVALTALIFLLLLKLFGSVVVRVVELVLLLFFLPLAFAPLTHALSLYGLEYGLALLALLLYWAYPAFKNAVALLVGALASVLLATHLSFWDVFALASLLSIYDYLAVRSGIMERLARATLSSVFVVGKPSSPEGVVRSFQEVEGVAMGLGDFTIAGALFLASYRVSPTMAFFVFLGLLGGLLALLALLRKGRILPALPYLTAGAFLGLFPFALLKAVGLDFG